MTRITKKEWYSLGGIENPKLYRVYKFFQWRYYKTVV